MANANLILLLLLCPWQLLRNALHTSGLSPAVEPAEAAPAPETVRRSNGRRHGRSPRRRPQPPPLLGRSWCVPEPCGLHLVGYFLVSRLITDFFVSPAVPIRNHLVAEGAAVVQGLRRSSGHRRPQRLQQLHHSRRHRRFQSLHLSSRRRSRSPRCCSGSPGSSRALPSRRATTSWRSEMRRRPNPGTPRRLPRLLASDRQIPPPFPL